jgi:putative transposase
LTEGKGVPLAVVISGANTHDIKLLEETLDSIVIFRPVPSLENPQNLCLDAGYVGSKEAVGRRGYIPHIRPRGEEKMEIERNPDFKAHRWVVEVCHSWLNRFRKLLVRFEKKAENYLALVMFACALITWRKTIHVHLS